MQFTIVALLSTVLVAFVLAAPYPEEKFLSVNDAVVAAEVAAATDDTPVGTDSPVEGSGEDPTGSTGATDATVTGATGTTAPPVTTTKSASTILSSVVLLVTAALCH